MGVHSLETYIENCVEKGFYDVNLKEAIDNFCNDHPGQKPILIFDVMSLIKLICTRFRYDIICGGRNWMYTQFLDNFFAGLIELKSELVFFCDGFVQDDKFGTWEKRQNQKYLKHIRVINQIYEGCEVNQILEKLGGELYANTILNVIESSCQKFGQLIYAVNSECDQEVARFALRNPRVLAVFSNDTDYLIFSGIWRYFSTKHINVNKFTTKVYSRSALRKHFHLSSYQLAIFASIAGNDFILYSQVKKFHEKLMGDSSELEHKSILPKIAKFIRKNFQNFNSSSAMIKFFAQAIFNTDDQGCVEQLVKSINFYRSLNELQSPINDYFLQNNDIFTFNVLNGNVTNFTLVYFDLRTDDLKNYFNVALPMFQRQAGAIFMMNAITDRKLTVCSKRAHSAGYKKFEVEPIFPFFQTPSMSDIYSTNEEYHNWRIVILKWLIDWNKYKNINIEALPDEYVPDILTIIFLQQRLVITSKEADLLLWTVKNVNRKMISKTIKTPQKLHPRAFRITFLYERTYSNVQRCIEVAGLKYRYSKPLNFDGVFFHNEYIRFADKEFDVWKHLNEL